MNLRIFVVSLLFAAFLFSILSVPYGNSQSSAVTTTMTMAQPAASTQCTIRSLAFSAVKDDAISGAYGSDAPISLYILTKVELDSIQNCHLASSARPLLAEENSVGYGNTYHALPFPTSGTYYFVFIASGPRSASSGYATVVLSFPTSVVLIGNTSSSSILVSSSNTKSLSSTTATTMTLLTSITSASSSVTSRASSAPSFETVGAIALTVVIALSASFVLLIRRRKTAQSTVTEEPRPPPKAEPLDQPPQPLANVLSTGYGDLDDLLQGGLPKRFAVLLLSPRCDERDLLLRKIIRSALSTGIPTFYLSNDLNKVQEMASTYGRNFYGLIPEVAKILSPPANLYKIPNIDSLSDLDGAFAKILDTRGNRGKSRFLIVDLLAYSHMFLVDKGVTAGKWFSDFLARRKAEDFTVLAFLNPLVASNEEKQTLIDVFDGVIEIYERELKGRSRRLLMIKRMNEHGYSESELMLDKEKLL